MDAFAAAAWRACLTSSVVRSIPLPHAGHCMLGRRSPAVSGAEVPHFGQTTENGAPSIA